jgi:hypothetical protein
MHCYWISISRALILLALAGTAVPGFAQQPAKTVVPFKLSFVGQPQPIVVATDPTIVAQPITLTGQSDLFGPFTGVALATVHRGVDEKPLFATVTGEWSMANGDALSVQITIVYPPQPPPGGPAFEAALLITNGKGRFLGARGSGFLTGSAQMDPATRQVSNTVSAEGLITPPKP